MKNTKSFLLKFLKGLIIPAIIIIIWFIASLDSTLIPSIGKTADVIIHPFRKPENLDSSSLGASLLISLLRVLCGTILAVITGVPLGIMAGRIKVIKDIFKPVIEMLRPICPVAWLPVAILIFGFSSFASIFAGNDAWRYGFLDEIKIAMVLIIWWGAFFPIFIGSYSGAVHIRKSHVEAAKLMGAKNFFLLRKIIFPATLPEIITGIKIGMGVGWMVIVAAEFFPGTRAGLGYMISASHQVNEYEWAFASIFAIGVTGLFINLIFTYFTDRFISWKKNER